MIVCFRISSMGFGGAERVFLSVANTLAREYQVGIHFVIDKLGSGETETLVKEKGFQLFGLDCERTLQSIFPLKNYIDTYQPDILMSAYTDTNLAALISAKLAKHQCKVIVSEHASLKEHWQHASAKRRFLLSTYVRFGYRMADHILAVSKGIAQQLIQLGNSPEKVSYIYNPVRFSASSPKSNNLIPTILAVGRISSQKDYLTLLQAFNLLIQNTQAKLVIVGGVHEESEKVKLDEFIAANNLAPYIDFVGFTENVQAYYAAADLFVLSSAWEGFGNVLVEALSFGLPIVSTDCNHGPAEILANGKFGQLVPVGDWQGMAKALNNMISKINVINKDDLRNRSLDFSEATIATDYWKLIKTLTDKT